MTYTDYVYAAAEGNGGLLSPFHLVLLAADHGTTLEEMEEDFNDLKNDAIKCGNPEPNMYNPGTILSFLGY